MPEASVIDTTAPLTPLPSGRSTRPETEAGSWVTVAEFIPPGTSGILLAVTKTGICVLNSPTLTRLLVPGGPIDSGFERPPSVVSDAFGAKLEASFADGKVTLSGAANVDTSVSGRVQAPNGSGLRNAQVVLTDAKGNTRTVTTGSFGYYSFDRLPIGGQFTLSVVSKRYTFDTRSVTTSGDRANVDLVARN